MAREFFYGVPVSGHMHPALGVVQELVRRGHEVYVYATPAWIERVDALGAIPRMYDDPSLADLEPPGNAFVQHAASRGRIRCPVGSPTSRSVEGACLAPWTRQPDRVGSGSSQACAEAHVSSPSVASTDTRFRFMANHLLRDSRAFAPDAMKIGTWVPTDHQQCVDTRTKALAET